MSGSIPNRDVDLAAVRKWWAIGTNLLLMTTGVGLLQVFWYYRKFRNDPTAFKVMVAFETLCCIGCSVNAMYAQYQLLSFASKEASLVLCLFKMQLFLEGIVKATVQGYFIWRFHCLFNKRCISYLLWFVTMGTLVASLLCLYLANPLPISLEKPKLWLQSILALVNAAIDFSVAIALFFFFKSMSRSSLLARNKHIFDRLSLYVVETSLLSSLFVVVSAVLFLLTQPSFVFMVANLPIPSLCLNALLASLNSRLALTSDSEDNQSFSLHEINFATQPIDSTTPTSVSNSSKPEVGVAV